MVLKLPDYTALGDLGETRSGASTPQIHGEEAWMSRAGDILASAYAKQGAAYGKIADAGAALIDTAVKAGNEQTKLEVARAEAAATTQQIALENKVYNDEEPGNAKQAWETGVAGINQQAAAGISDPKARELFTLKRQVDAARGAARVDNYARQQENQQLVASIGESIDSNIAHIGQARDEDEVKTLIRSSHDQIDAAADRGAITPIAAQKWRRQVAEKYGEAWLQGLPPEKQREVLEQSMRPPADQAAPKGKFEGMLEQGNIDLSRRPVVKNEDGSISTVRSMSVSIDGKEVLIPTVSPDGKVLSNDDAIELYRKTGQNLGKFDTPEHADAYAKALHGAQERYYGPRSDATPAGGASRKPVSFAPEVDKAIDEAAAEEGLDPALLRRMAKIESSGNPNAQTGSYKGLFQMSDTEFDKYGEGDIWNARDNARAAAAKTAAEVEQFKAKYGRDPSPTEIYLQHQQGVGGLAAHLAEPDRPAWESMASTAEGRQKGEGWARQAIWGNVPDKDKARFGSVDNITSRQFVDLWRGRVEGDTAVGGSANDTLRTNTPLDFIAPQRRQQLLNHIDAQLLKQQKLDAADLSVRMQDSATEALATGATKNIIPDADILRVYGPEAGQAVIKQYRDQLQLGADKARMAQLSPADQDKLLQSYLPQSGPGYAEQLKTYGKVLEAAQQARIERDKDPAAFAISRLPGVSDAWSAMSNAPPDQLPQAAATYANVARAEQLRVGVAAQDVKILPKYYVEDLKRQLDNPQAAGGPDGVVKTIRSQAALWGSTWPEVYRQIAPKVDPVVRVIGSGIGDQPARILAEIAPMKIGDILKDQSAEKANQIKRDVLDAFVPLNRTMDGNTGGLAAFNDFREQAEKLSAFYIVRGMDSGRAARKAYDDLVGDRYDLSDSFRVPKDQHVNADDIQRGTVVAMRDLDKQNLAPARDNVGGLSQEYLVQSRVDAVRRDGKWATAPDESGLVLTYNNEAVRRADGSPVLLTWNALNSMATAQKAEAARQAEELRTRALMMGP